MLLHYLGDESIVIDFPHGNAKSDQVFQRTCPSVLTDLASICDHPCIIYKNAISSSGCPTEYQPPFMPRNSRQIKNVQNRVCQKGRLTQDSLYIHELAYDLDGFVKTITTYRDLVVICGPHRVICELDSVFHLVSDCPQLLSYNTTFQFSDFYLSAPLFRHMLFSNSPVIPAFFLVHERKLEEVHERFMEYMARLIPTLVSGKWPVYHW